MTDSHVLTNQLLFCFMKCVAARGSGRGRGTATAGAAGKEEDPATDHGDAGPQAPPGGADGTQQ